MPTDHLYRFPKDEHRRRLWKESIARPDLEIRASTCVCSEHFKEEDLVCLVNRTRISDTALPVLNIVSLDLLIQSHTLTPFLK